MPLGWPRFTHDDDHHILASAEIVKPPLERPDVSKTHTPTNLIRGSQRVKNTLFMFREQVGMMLGNVPLALGGQFDITMQVWTRKQCHCDTPFTIRNKTIEMTPCGSGRRTMCLKR